MPTLADTYGAIHAVLRGEQSLDEGSELLGVDPARLAIYARFVRGHVEGILAKQYPLVRQTLTAEVWRDLCGGFFTAHPPSHWELNAAAEPFASYLADQLGVIEGVTLLQVSLAQFEWAQWEAFSDLACMPEVHTLQASVVNPTLRILELPCPVIDAVLALKRGEALNDAHPPSDAGPEQVLVFRHPVRQTSAFWRVTEPLVLALTTVDAQLDAEQGAQRLGRTAQEVTVGLSRAREIGLIIGPED